jgi:ribonuclease P/MRP protein subunit RPP40
LVKDEDSCRAIQQDLDNLCNWSEKWKLRFNSQKCKVLHIGRSNINYNYTMKDSTGNNTLLKSDIEETDLGVTFSINLKFDKHIGKCVSKTNRILGLIKHTFDYLDEDMFVTIYKSLVRPLMEYATPVWSPYLKKDIRALERVQRRATKLVVRVKDLTYRERLLQIGIPTLEYRRERADMIQVYRIVMV